MLLCQSNIDMHVEKKKSYSWQGFKIANPSHFIEFAKTISVNVSFTKHQKERHIWVILIIYFDQTSVKENVSFNHYHVLWVHQRWLYFSLRHF